MTRRPAVLLVALLAAAACRPDRQGPTDAESSQPGAPVGNVTSQQPLFTLVPSSTLAASQAAILSRIQARRSSVVVHVGLLTSTPRLVLQPGTAVLLQLSPTRQFVAVGEQAVDHESGALSWTGPLQNEFGRAQLVLTNQGVTGTLWTTTVLYRIEPIGGGFHALMEVGTFPPDDPPEIPSTEPQPPFEPPLGSAMIGEANRLTASVPTTIDVLVVYTPAVAAAVTDVAALIQLAVDETNTSYANSGINAAVRSVYSAQVTYTEAGRTYQQHVAALQSTSDGIIDIVHTWRNQYSADVVVLLVADTTYCGWASQIPATQITAFAAVGWDCATGNYSFGHEIGHLQGARHDRFVDNSSSPYAYGHGFVDPLNYNWRTIMAYQNSCVSHTGHGCVRVQYWSNPNVIYGPTGQAMGTTTYEHDARVLDGTKITVANFRSSLMASWTGPQYYVGHSDMCPWTATINGGTPPYSFNWYATWTTASTGFYFVSGQGTANATSYGYYYQSYPNPTTITVNLYGSDAAGEQYNLQRSIGLYYSPMGCH